MHRRTVLAGAALSSLVAGCSILEPQASACQLSHERVSDPENYAEPLETYHYQNVSPAAQAAIEETVATGTYTLENPRREPEEFRYWDTTSVYEVVYDTETHVLITYTSAGCER